MQSLKDLIFYPEKGTSRWWTLLEDDVELFIDSNRKQPDDLEIELAQTVLNDIETLCEQSLNYIDIWIDRNRKTIGLENWLSTICLYPNSRKGGQTKIQFGFADDTDSNWWVLFNNPYNNIVSKYQPIAFGRSQV